MIYHSYFRYYNHFDKILVNIRIYDIRSTSSNQTIIYSLHCEIGVIINFFYVWPFVLFKK